MIEQARSALIPSGRPGEDYFRGERADLLSWLGGRYRTVLEVGCGAGGNAGWLREHGATRIVGIELDPTSARQASEVFDLVLDCPVEVGLPKVDERIRPDHLCGRAGASDRPLDGRCGTPRTGGTRRDIRRTRSRTSASSGRCGRSSPAPAFATRPRVSSTGLISGSSRGAGSNACSSRVDGGQSGGGTHRADVPRASVICSGS